MKLNFDEIKDPAKDAQPRRFKFELTPGSIFALVVVAILGVTWAFILGILVGRGFRPEKAVPELATIMPTPQAENQTIPQEPLRAEDLQFYETLQKRPDGSKPMPPQRKTTLAPESRTGADAQGAQAARAAKAAAEQARKAEAAEKAKAKAESQRLAADRKSKEAAELKKAKAKEAADAKARAAEEAKKSKQAESKKSKNESKYEIDKNDPLRDGVYNYIYQVASLENQAQAQDMLKRLKALGFAASIEPVQSDGRTMYRVNVPFKGRPIDTREMKDKLATAGVKKPLLRSKKPI